MNENWKIAWGVSEQVAATARLADWGEPGRPGDLRAEVLELREAERGTEVFTEFDPVLLRNGQEDFHHFRIELRAGTAANFFARVRHRKGIAIRAVAQHRVEGIGDGEDT